MNDHPTDEVTGSGTATGVTRRSLLLGAAALPAGALLAGCATPAAAAAGVLNAADLQLAPGTPYPLVALPGKAPLGQVYDRPPNYETPAGHLIGQRNYPYTDNEYYYVRYREAEVSTISRDEYRLTVGGDAVTRQLDLSFADLDGRADTTVGAVGMCTGEGRGLHRPLIPGLPWTKGDLSCAEWTGVRLADLMREAGITPAAKNLSFEGGRIISLTKPQYWRSYPVADLMASDAILATRMNGQELNFWNGFPVRLVVPGSYAPPWVKQLVRIEARTTPQPMEWSGRKITINKLKVFSVICTPTDGTRIPRGATVEIVGEAHDDGTGITKVETSMDDAATWQPAQLEAPVGTYTWRVFRTQLTFDRPGEQRVLTRATNAKGEVQELDVSADVVKNGARKETSSRLFAGVFQVQP